MTAFLTCSATLAGLLCSLPVHGDTLRLKDGRVVMGQYEGGSARVIRFRTDAGITEYDLLNVSSVRIAAPASSAAGDSAVGDSSGGGGRVVIAFGSEQERIIRSWFSDRSNLAGLPPGLARRSSLPPGLAGQVQRNGTLPPGLQRRVQPLPWDLESRLPRLVDGIERVILGRDALLIESASGRIVDLLRNVY